MTWNLCLHKFTLYMSVILIISFIQEEFNLCHHLYSESSPIRLFHITLFRFQLYPFILIPRILIVYILSLWEVV